MGTKRIFFTAVCSLVVVISLMGCASKAERKLHNNTAKPSNITSAHGELHNGYTLVVPLEDGRTWSVQMKSGHFRTEGKRQIFTLKDVNCRLTKEKRGFFTASADTAIMTVNGETVEASLSGHVRADDATRARSFTADTLAWDSTAERIHTTSFFWKGGGMTLSADQGSFSTMLTNAKCSGRVKLTVSGDR